MGVPWRFVGTGARLHLRSPDSLFMLFLHVFVACPLANGRRRCVRSIGTRRVDRGACNRRRSADHTQPLFLEVFNPPRIRTELTMRMGAGQAEANPIGTAIIPQENPAARGQRREAAAFIAVIAERRRASDRSICCC